MSDLPTTARVVVARQLAPWIRRVILVMLCTSLLWVPVTWLIALNQPAVQLSALIAIMPSLIGSPIALLLLARGAQSSALIAAACASLGCIVLSMIFWGLRDGPDVVSALFVPLIFAALAGSSRILAGALASVILVLVGVGVLDLFAPQLIGFVPVRSGTTMLTIAVFVFSACVVGYFLYQFSRSLRTALVAALRRQQELERYREQLEQQVDARTSELRALAAQLQRQNRNLLASLELARDIQVSLLPSQVPWDRRWLDVASVSLPAFEVGGDFYTYAALDQRRMAVAIGDISGKGVSAALLMSLTLSLLEDRVLQISDPGSLVTALNAQLLSRLRRNRMNAALLHAVIDLETRVMRFCNAGMLAPIVVRDGAVLSLEVGHLPVGALEGCVYRTMELRLLPGDLLLLLSDGVVEAQNEQRELFGFARLEMLLRRLSPDLGAEAAVAAILAAVQAFCGAARQHDDMTILALQLSDTAQFEMVESPELLSAVEI